MTNFIAICRPETGAVRSQHLITDHDVAFLVKTELELGICNDDATAQGVVCTFLVECDGVITNLGSVLLTLAREIFLEVSNALLVRDILIMVTDLSLSGRREDRLRQFLGLLKTFRQGNSTNSTVLFVACPTASGDVTANNALERNHVQLPAHHRLAIELRSLEKLRHFLDISSDHMVRKNIFCEIKPELGHLSQNLALVGHCVMKNHIKTTNAVSCYHNQAVAIVIDFAYLSFFNRFHLLILSVCMYFRLLRKTESGVSVYE